MGIDGKTVVNGWENHGKNAIRYVLRRGFSMRNDWNDELH